MCGVYVLVEIIRWSHMYYCFCMVWEPGQADQLSQTLAGWPAGFHINLASSTSGVQINTCPCNILDFSRVAFSYGKPFPDSHWSGSFWCPGAGSVMEFPTDCVLRGKTIRHLPWVEIESHSLLKINSESLGKVGFDQGWLSVPGISFSTSKCLCFKHC